MSRAAGGAVRRGYGAFLRSKLDDANSRDGPGIMLYCPAMVIIETNSTAELTGNEAVAALERFVVENDELLELEERIGRFNIFDALRIDRVEIRHSNFLAWLLDPNESHGQGGLFLRALLMDLFKTARENGFPCPVSPIELDGEDLRGVEIRREWKHIDLLISCDQPRFVVAIENKIDSGEHSGQLKRYVDTVKAEFGDVPTMYVFLTVEGDEPSEEDWVPYSYGDVHRVLSRVRNANATSVGEDVIAFLDHYLRLIRGRLMDDPKIDELCSRIYKNHRQAIELIYERGRPQLRGIVEELREMIRSRKKYEVYPEGGSSVYFIPLSWLEVLPPIREKPPHEPSQWFIFEFRLSQGQADFWLYACPTIDGRLRRRIVERLVQDPQEFGLKSIFSKIPEKYATIFKSRIGKWDDDFPDAERIVAKSKNLLDQLEDKLKHAPDAIREAVSAWQNQSLQAEN